MNKIEAQIKQVIHDQIDGDLTISNLHGVDLKTCLVEPYLETLEDSFNEGQTIQVYVVLKEFPESNEGYQIVYDPKEKLFGLSIAGKNSLGVFIGFYGTFLDTLKGM